MTGAAGEPHWGTELLSESTQKNVSPDNPLFFKENNDSRDEFAFVFGCHNKC